MDVQQQPILLQWYSAVLRAPCEYAQPTQKDYQQRGKIRTITNDLQKKQFAQI